MLKLEGKRLDEMNEFGYKWFGMYPLHKISELMYFVNNGYGIYEIRNDDSEGFLGEEDLDEAWEKMLNGEVMVAVDLTNHLYLRFRNYLIEEKGYLCVAPFDVFKDVQLYDLDFIKELLD